MIRYLMKSHNDTLLFGLAKITNNRLTTIDFQFFLGFCLDDPAVRSKFDQAVRFEIIRSLTAYHTVPHHGADA